MTHRPHYRQGDVLLIAVDAIPANAVSVEPEGGRLILARGEATGHHHSVAAGGGACLYRADDAGGVGAHYVKADDVVPLAHQEHTAVALPASVYLQAVQVEWFPDAVRRVAD